MKKITLGFRRVLPAVCAGVILVAFASPRAYAQAGGPGGVLNIPDPITGGDNGGAPPPPAPERTPSTSVTAPPAPVTTPPPAHTMATPPPIVAPSTTGDTIVDTTQRVQATKRGICENHMSQEDFIAVGKGVSWFYNWAANSSDQPPESAHMHFIPMAWGHGGDPGAIAGALGLRPPVVLALNEPNLKGQAFLPPQDAAEFYLKVKQSADAQHIPVVGPNMALGSATGDSITAVDPVTKQKTTYTSMKAYLEAYFHYIKPGEMPAGIGVHSYGGMGDLKGAVAVAYEVTHKPVWVTEFAWWDAKSPDDEVNYLRQAVEFLENSSQVAGYAWFMNRAGKNPKISILDTASGKLTPLGQEYVKLPSHSMHVFYRVPGVLDAGKYVRNENMTLEDTSDADGDFDMVSRGMGWVAYNIFVDVPGTYVLRLRVSGAPGKLAVVQNGEVIGTADTKELGWHTVETTVKLAAGKQTLRVDCNGQALHSIEFGMRAAFAMSGK